MLTYRFGLAVSTSSAEARNAYVDAIDRMPATAGHIDESLQAAIEADPEFALAHAALARHHQLRGRIREAKAAAEMASRLTAAASGLIHLGAQAQSA